MAGHDGAVTSSPPDGLVPVLVTAQKCRRSDCRTAPRREYQSEGELITRRFHGPCHRHEHPEDGGQALQVPDSELQVRVTKMSMVHKVSGILVAFLVGLLVAGLVTRPMWVYAWGFVAGLVGGLFAAIWGTELKVKSLEE